MACEPAMHNQREAAAEYAISTKFNIVLKAFDTVHNGWWSRVCKTMYLKLAL